jgi:4-methyl-5(b-hydroxyethyl)-thiazole monophosphate biosynthesis
MARALVLLANGFEEIEAVTIIDVLRRAGVTTVAAGLSGERGGARGAHGITLETDVTLDALDAGPFDALVLPGGMPGSATLRDDARVQRLIQTFARDGKLVAAICAAPIALDSAGVLRGRRATCFPGFELPSAELREERVVEDGNVVTSRGPGTALEFALALAARLTTPDTAAKLGATMLVRE